MKSLDKKKIKECSNCGANNINENHQCDGLMKLLWKSKTMLESMQKPKQPVDSKLNKTRSTGKPKELSLCKKGCNCMTKTIDGVCGKCGQSKENLGKPKESINQTVKYLWLLVSLIFFIAMLKTDIFDKQILFMFGGIICIIIFLLKE